MQSDSCRKSTPRERVFFLLYESTKFFFSDSIDQALVSRLQGFGFSIPFHKWEDMDLSKKRHTV